MAVNVTNAKKTFLQSYSEKSSVPADFIEMLWDKHVKDLDPSVSQEELLDSVGGQIISSLQPLDDAMMKVANGTNKIDKSRSNPILDPKIRSEYLSELQTGLVDYKAAFDGLFDPDSTSYLGLGSGLTADVDDMGSVFSSFDGWQDVYDTSENYRSGDTSDYNLGVTNYANKSNSDNQSIIDYLKSDAALEEYTPEEVEGLITKFQSDIDTPKLFNNGVTDSDRSDNYNLEEPGSRAYQMESQRLRTGSQTNAKNYAYGELVESKGKTNQEAVVPGSRASSHSDAMYQDSQTGNSVNANEGAKRAEGEKLGLEGQDLDRYVATGIVSNTTTQGTTGANKENPYKALLDEETTVEEVTAPDDLSEVVDDTTGEYGTDTKDDGSSAVDGETASFSGTITPESKYRDLLTGQLATGLSDSLAGRPSNSILAGERMGAEGLSRVAADNMGTASQGVSNSGNLGQGAAINATQGVGRANAQEFGTMAARNTMARANEQKEARGQTQDFLQYSEGVRKSKVTEENMKLGSMLDWYKELKGTHAGNAETLMEGMRDITGTQLTEEQQQFQKDQANLSDDNRVAAGNAQAYLDNDDYRSLASEFKIDPATGSYVYIDGTGKQRALDPTYNAKVKAALSFGGMSGFEYDSNGNVITNASFVPGEFNANLTQAFESKNFKAIDKLSAYIPDYGTGDTTAFDIMDGNHKVGEIIEFNGEPVRIASISNTTVQVQDSNGEFFTIGGL